MKLKFEDWLTEQKFTPTVNSIFREAVVCYKAEAYRASMVMSYIGFQTILKERMLNASTPPSGIVAPVWSTIQRNLLNDDKWDEEVKNAVQKKTDPIFAISDGLRSDVTYWKDRRNDCAHFKTNDISYYHIDSFWGFIQDNLPKLMINGGFAALANKIETHFDISKTPADQDYTHLIKEIEAAIKPSELPSFFTELYRIFTSLGLPDEKQFEFYNEVLKNCNASIQAALRSFLTANPTLMVAFFRHKPNRISEFNLDAVAVRNLWYTVLFEGGTNDFGIYCELLDKGLIPTTDIAEANKVVLWRMWSAMPNNAHEGAILKKYGFFDFLHKTLIDEHQITQFGFCNDKANLITYYIANYPLEDEMVKAICNNFTSSFYARDLAYSLGTMFTSNPEKLREFNTIVAVNGWSPPTKIRGLA